MRSFFGCESSGPKKRTKPQKQREEVVSNQRGKPQRVQIFPFNLRFLSFLLFDFCSCYFFAAIKRANRNAISIACS
jgi:hypothetical protein